MKILIIGGSRFIGKHLLFELAEKSNDITVINRGSLNIKYPSNCTHLKVDRTKPEELKRVLKNKTFDIVFDFYAMRSKETKEIIENLNGRIERFIHISSIFVYDLEHVENFPSYSIFEEDSIGPTTADQFAYTREKRLCEQLLFEAYTKNKFPMTIIRPTYVYGPDNHIYRERYFFDRVKFEHPIFLPKHEISYFDLIFVDDLVSLCIKAAEQSKAIGQAYNATGGEITSGGKLAHLTGDIIGKKPLLEYYSNEDLKAVGWPGERELYPYPISGFHHFSNLKAVNELGFKPQYRLKEGMRVTYEWCEKQQFQQPDWSLEEKLLKHIKN